MLRAWMLVVVAACGGASKPSSQPSLVPLVATPESAEAAYDAKNWSECATQWLSVSAHATGEAKSGALYDAACCYALDGRLEDAVATLGDALDGGYWDAEHMVVDEDLMTVREHAKWPALTEHVKQNLIAFEANLVDPALRRELLDLAQKDQRTRASDDTGAMQARAHDNLVRMKEVVAKYGWPSRKVVGTDGANAAWSLVQHADADVDFQKECLEKMEPLVKSGDVAAKDYAFLFDRVAVGQGRKQRYGTQLDGDDFAPIEDPQNVDARRKEMGLPSLAEYRELIRAQQK
jgi:hypothetical protein